MTAREKIKAIFEEICPDVDFEKETALVDDGIIESFDVIQGMNEIMEAFDIEIDADDIEPENLNSIDAMAAMVERKLG